MVLGGFWWFCGIFVVFLGFFVCVFVGSLWFLVILGGYWQLLLIHFGYLLFLVFFGNSC